MASRRKRPPSIYGCAASAIASRKRAESESDSEAIFAFHPKSAKSRQYSASDSHALYASKVLAGEKRLRVNSLEALRGISLLVYSSAFHMLQDAKWFQPILAAATIALQTNSTHALLAAARAGAGVAVLPRFVARGQEDLVAVSSDVADHDVWLITHPEVRRDPQGSRDGRFPQAHRRGTERTLLMR